MASMWRKAMVYLGLGPDDEYEEYDSVEERAPEASPRPQPKPKPKPKPKPAPPREPAAVTTRPKAPPRQPPNGGRAAPARPSGSTAKPAPPPEPSYETSAVRTLPSSGGGEAGPPKARPAVRAVPAVPSAKPHVIMPSSFNQAQELADKFKANQPVILNLQGVDRDLARRLIDFSSGLCYGIGGHMEKVAHQVYLLTPTNVEVSAEERRRLSERGLHDS